MSGFGPCRDCPKPSIVKYNDAPLCLTHFENTLAEFRAVLTILNIAQESSIDGIVEVEVEVQQ